MQNEILDSPTAQLTQEQIRETFEFLGLPIKDAANGSPIFIQCPYQELHTKKNAAKDTLLYFDTYPHIWCLHKSCADARRELNFAMRVVVMGTGAFPESKLSFLSPSPEASELAVKVARDRARILSIFSGQVRPLSEINLTPSEFLARLFRLDDVLWIGQKTDSGKERNRKNFRTVAEWLKSPAPLWWPYTAGSTFKAGTISRSASAVAVRRYLILESDTLSLEETRAMFEWACQTLELELRAIVFSGSKSYHGWFESKGEEWLADFKPILVSAGFCEGPLSLSQPVRLANTFREETNAKQKLLWMKI